MPSNHTSLRSRRSTLVPLKVAVGLEGVAESTPCDGETIMVNLYGALILNSMELCVGIRIWIHVYLTDKRTTARVVYVDSENPLCCGVELDKPQNIWAYICRQTTGIEMYRF
jgi:hypothetical protein